MWRAFFPFLLGCAPGNDPLDSAEPEPDVLGLIAAAGNTSDEAERWQILLQLDGAVTSEDPLRADLDLLLDTANHWANAPDFWEPGDQGMAGEDGYLAGWFNLRVWPDGVGDTFPTPVSVDSPLEPLWCLYRGRLLVWATLQNGLLADEAYEDARGCFQVTLDAHPDNALAGMYLDVPMAWDPVEGGDAQAPQWAQDQRQILHKLTDILDFWRSERQMSDGQFGGGWGDDVEIWRRFPALTVGFDVPEHTEAFTRLAEGLWALPRMEGGYTNIATDVEHSAEDSGDTLTSMLLMSEDPVWGERAAGLSDLAQERWTGVNDLGQRQFVSTQITSDGASDDPALACDTATHTRVLGPALVHWQQTGDAALSGVLTEWMHAWVTAAEREDQTKPLGVLPNALAWPTGSPGGTSGDWLDPGCHLNAEAYEWPRFLSPLMRALVLGAHAAADPTLLEPVRSMADHRRTSLAEGVGATGTATWAASETAGDLADALSKHRSLTGSTEFDDLLLVDGSAVTRARLTGDWSAVNASLATTVQALSQDRAAFTTEVRFTDRIVKFHSGYASRTAETHSLDLKTLYALVTGDDVDPLYVPLPAVRWHTHPTDIAVRVLQAEPQALEAELWLFDGTERTLDVSVLRMQAEHTWTLFHDGTAVDSGSVDGSGRFTLTLPPGQALTLRVE